MSIRRQMSKRVKAHACQIKVQDMIQSLLDRERERERKRDSYSQPYTMTLKNKGKDNRVLDEKGKKCV